MADSGPRPKEDTEDGEWVTNLTRQRDAEKQVMLEMSNAEEQNPKTSGRYRKLLYFLLLTFAVAIVVLSVKLSTSGGKNEVGPMGGTGLESKYSETREMKEEPINTKPGRNFDKTKPEREVCTTEECIFAAAQILESVDPAADPCEDFYDYACGRWLKTRVIPADRSYLAPYGLLRDEVALKLKAILEEEISENETETFQNLKKLYRSCVNEELVEQRNESVVYPLLRELGGWPILGDAAGGEWDENEFDLVRLLLVLAKYNNKPLISIWAGRDDLNGSRNSMFIDQPHLGLPSRNYFLEPTLTDKLMAYRQLIISVATMLGADVTTVGDDVNNVLKLETDLANITMSKEERRDNTRLYNSMDIAELALNFSNSPECRKPQFDWLKFLQGAMQILDEPVAITADEEVVLVSLPYYSRLWDVLSNHSPRTITNYVIWRIMLYRISNLPRRFQDEYQTFREKMYGSSAKAERWRTCANYVKGVNRMATGRLFVERHFDHSSREEAHGMIQNIRESFYDAVEKLSWMDEGMKQDAKEKGKKIAVAVGYPENLMNDTVLEEESPLVAMNEDTYFENVLTVLQEKAKYYLKYLRLINSDERPQWTTSPATVNAFYIPQMNQISFPAGILQPPYFHVGRPRSLNYGALGFLVGHEITHGFDDRGRQYDKEGNMYNWWTPEADAKFKELAQCIVDQYGAFYWEEAELHVNGINTQGENIADNGGLKQAFAGYTRWKLQNNDDLKLPGLNYTGKQLFFLGFAQTRCSLSRKDGAINHIQSGVHSPNRFRVIGTLRNMPAFAEVFECPVNSGMNPENKCAVW